MWKASSHISQMRVVVESSKEPHILHICIELPSPTTPGCSAAAYSPEEPNQPSNPHSFNTEMHHSFSGLNSPDASMFSMPEERRSASSVVS
eukprot:Gb_13567 [translate_table: standard]